MKLLRLVPALALLTLFLPPAKATWSICLVDTATGEVAIGTATCLENIDIQNAVPVIVVGHGVAAAQSAVSGPNKVTIFNGFQSGATPQEILDFLAANDGFHQGRQYGIVDLTSPSVSFTGTAAGEAKHDLTGTLGTLKYAAQGNVLTGDAVVFAIEDAVVNTPGDVGQKVMAAMEAARALGGDGRCSCAPFNPTACGVPPPGFEKSAHIGTVIVARVGDDDGPCTAFGGCANGEYYLDINVIGDDSDPDPVFELQTLYDTWRASLSGRPDHVLSTVAAGAQSLPADGVTSTSVTVSLADVDGVPLTSGGATIAINGSSLTSAGAVTDLGDGSYSFDVTAGTTTGSEELAIVVDDGVVEATLFPFLSIEVESAAPLHCGYDEVSATTGATVPFVIDFDAGLAGEPYLLVAGASGTNPGVPLAGGIAPLNPDVFTTTTLQNPGPPLLPGSIGLLDAAGRANASFVLTTGLAPVLVGLHLDWVAITLGAVPTPTNADGFDVLP